MAEIETASAHRNTSLPDSDIMTDVVIVGAGPTGLIAAALLLRCGVGVRILDKSPSPAKESRAFGIQARSMELFGQIGVAEELLERGVLATGTQIFVDGKQAAELNFDDIGRADTPYQFLLMVPQSEIEEVLVAEVRRLGVEVERGVEVTDLEQRADAVLVRAWSTASEAVAVRARYVIGADGAHSIVRKLLGLQFGGAPYPQDFLLADCQVDWPLEYGHFKLFVHGRGLGLYLPLKGNKLARVMAMDLHPPAADPSIAAQGSSAVSLPEVEAAFKTATGVDVRLSKARWTARYRVHHRGVDRYRVDRVFVAGDAAHIHSPAGGQGMNTGLQDAANLAWKLALVLKGSAGDALLDTYHAERWPVGNKVLAYTDRLFSFMTTQTDWAARLRNLFLPAFTATVSRLGTARNRAFHFISELGIRYKQSDFVHDALSHDVGKAFREAPSAGHRAPNADFARHRDVFDLLDGYRFQVLAFSRSSLTEAEITDLDHALADLKENGGLDLGTHLITHSLIGRDERLHRAESGQAFAAYGVDHDTPQALYLVRPDGYIAWRANRLDLAGCRQFIAQKFSASTHQ